MYKQASRNRQGTGRRVLKPRKTGRVGTIEWISRRKGGSIAIGESIHIPFANSGLRQTGAAKPRKGDRVEFEVKRWPDGPQAFDIRKVGFSRPESKGGKPQYKTPTFCSGGLPSLGKRR